MITVYIANIKEFMNTEALTKMASFVSDSRVQRMDAYRPLASKARSLLAGALFQYAYLDFQKQLPIKRKEELEKSSSSYCLYKSLEGIEATMGNVPLRLLEVDFGRALLDGIERLSFLEKAKNLPVVEGMNGKPRLEDGPCFNISHSGDFVAVVMGDLEIGLDIQEKRRASEALKRRVLSPAEIKQMGEAEEDELFSVFWCQKEAAVKCFGEGLSMLSSTAEDGWTEKLGLEMVSFWNEEEQMALSVCIKKDCG